MSRSLNRLTITAAITRALHQFPTLVHLCNKSTHFLFPFLRRFLSRAIRLMESLLFSNDDDDFLSSPFDHSFVPPSFSDPGEFIHLVSYRWWKEAMCGGAVVGGTSGVGGVLYNAAVRVTGAGKASDDEECVIGGFGDSEIFVGMRREGETVINGEEGVSGGVGDLALVSEWMFFSALKWHFDRKDVDNLLNGEDSAQDMFSLQIRLFYVNETSQLIIKITQKDNEPGSFSKAYRILCTKPDMLQIWDFSGQTALLMASNGKQSMKSGQPNEEVLLQLQVYYWPYTTIMDQGRRKEDMMMEHSMIDGSSTSSSIGMNGTVDKVNLFSKVGSGICATGALGLTGLYNLGNTCFMNSAIQCLVHTPKLVDYFLGNFREDLNFENPLGMNGKLAIAFGDLLRKLWAPAATTVAPRMFKSTISTFAPQFSGYNQHDSQEFLAFLLDGLHEDLNRVKRKPYIQAKDEDGRPDEEVADEYWGNHLSRNDSIIVDLCQGQYRSTLVCPICKRSSVTFDPFMYLSLPLPLSTMRKMTLTVLSPDGSTLPHPVTISVPSNGTLKDIAAALAIACSLKDYEMLLIAEIYNNLILRVLNDPDDSIELIRDYDQLVAYRLRNDMEGSPMVVFMHQQEDKSYLHSFPTFKKFGIPLVARMSDISNGSDIHKQFVELISPFLLPSEDFLNHDALGNSVREDEETNETILDKSTSSNDKAENDLDAHSDFEFYLEAGNFYSGGLKIELDKPVPISNPDSLIKVLVTWPEKMIQCYDTAILSLLPEVSRSNLTSKWNQDSILLYKCVDAFLKEEPLGPEDMWYCPRCKVHRQASKKLDLWRLPEILVIHLKRFSYTRFLKNKLESLVDFPVEGFDLSDYVIHKDEGVCSRYTLFAVSNHYGGMGGGHYTAFVKHRLSRWYEFDDSHVFPVSEEQIKTQAAYVLFYKRI